LISWIQRVPAGGFGFGFGFSIASWGWMNPGISAKGLAPSIIRAENRVLVRLRGTADTNPRHNLWSGIHTRLSAEIIEHQKQVDGLIVWEWICSTIGRPCPKLKRGEGRTVTVGSIT
jgi:hypothetical protein